MRTLVRFTVLTSVSVLAASAFLSAVAQQTAQRSSPGPCRVLGGVETLPFFGTAWENTYPSSQSLANVDNGTGSTCALCHSDINGGDGWNLYGWQLRMLTQTQIFEDALAMVEGSDGDGDPGATSNLAEITAHTQPGWTVGPNNTHYFSDGSTLPGQLPPPGILGDLDPSLDLDIAAFRIRKGTLPGALPSFALRVFEVRLVVTNEGVVDQPGTATVTATRGGVVVYQETLPVSAAVGGAPTLVRFPDYPAAPLPFLDPELTWTAEVFDDDPDLDVSTLSTPLP